MRPRSARRILVIEVLVVSLVLTLFGRLVYVQELDKNKPVQTAGVLHDGRIILPAARGEYVDARGRPLLTNRSTYVVTVNRSVLLSQPCDGAAVLSKLATLLATIEDNVGRYAVNWPARSSRPLASSSPGPVTPPGPNAQFPSAQSTPPASIMNAEPAAAAPASQAQAEAPGAEPAPPIN